MESGKLSLDARPENVPLILDENRKEYEAFAIQKGLAFRVEIPDGLPQAVIDAKLVQRAVSNLIQNAMKFTARGGSVTLKAGLAGGEDGGHVAISVSDTGCGIPAEDLKRVFEKYYRSSGSKGVKGSGLGLAIVKAVAEAHGGRVEVESEPGRGSTFVLLLPVENITADKA
jgi:signal transduction histidine kinase